MAEDQKGLIDQEGRFRSIGGRQNGNRQRSDGGVKGRDAGNYLQINSSRIYCTADDTELTSCLKKAKRFMCAPVIGAIGSTYISFQLECKWLEMSPCFRSFGFKLH